MKCISLVGLRNKKGSSLLVVWCQFVNPFESFEWRMGFTTGEKELSIREMNMAEVWCHSLSIRSNGSNGEWDLRPEKKSCRSEK